MRIAPLPKSLPDTCAPHTSESATAGWPPVTICWLPRSTRPSIAANRSGRDFTVESLVLSVTTQFDAAALPGRQHVDREAVTVQLVAGDHDVVDRP